MKVVLLAGGYGTRISEESHLKPKPMIEIGGRPILWHIMKEYSSYGYNDFVICCGYRGYVIKEYFANYYLHGSDITFDFTNNNQMTIHNNASEPWRVTLVDTGLDTMTGGRIKRIQPYIEDEPFLLTYGDGLSDININKLVEFHQNGKKLLTLTAIQPGSRFGTLEINSNSSVSNFTEKSKTAGGWINAGYMVCQPNIFHYIDGDNTIFEHQPLERLAKEENLLAYCYDGFWQCMDTMRDKMLLEELWESQNCPWRVW